MSEQARVSSKELVEHFFRHEYGRLVATLARMFGVHQLGVIEDAVQGALMSALTAWAQKGPPDDPAAWLYRVAHNQLLDGLRRVGAQQRRQQRECGEPDSEAPEAPRFLHELHDDQLRMLFVCCDDAIPAESQLVLALKTLCGFSTGEIARALFTSEANVHKRLARARERLRAVRPVLDTPDQPTLSARLAAVHTVLYLLFNQGYHSSQPDQLVRGELCEEAIRLCALLVQHPVGDVPATRALLALMYLHAARLATRTDEAGCLLLLEDQDRSLWDRELAQLGMHWLRRSAEGDELTRYHVEAGISAEHCFAASFAETRWGEIADLYAMLERLAPSPLNTLNRAVAIAQRDGPQAGLGLLMPLRPPGWLVSYYLWDAVLGELLRKAGERGSARVYLERALAGAPTESERMLLRRRLAACCE